MLSTSGVKNVYGKNVLFVHARSDLGKKVFVDPYVSRPKSRAIHSRKRQYSSRFVPTCYHCDKVGDIRPKCIKLRPHEHVNENPSPRNDHEGCSK